MCGRFLFFFFKQKTAYEMRISDWSSDVCSSDLRGGLFILQSRFNGDESFSQYGDWKPLCDPRIGAKAPNGRFGSILLKKASGRRTPMHAAWSGDRKSVV